MTHYRGDPDHFAHEWIDAWNAHDLERVLAHWAEDCLFVSPVAARLLGDGTVVGKDALRAYWTRALAASGDLRFDFDTVYGGVDSVVIGYRNHRGQRCAEWLRFVDGYAVEGRAHYSPA
ncbi:MAG: nuclear transport factor 2 family protein [Sandaracinaceae bacterium]|nr:nuclear transport factor 2 family protein [Sandaracinaceae bacterium]